MPKKSQNHSALGTDDQQSKPESTSTMDKLLSDLLRRRQFEDETHDRFINGPSIEPSEVTNLTLKNTLAAVRSGDDWVRDLNSPGGWRYRSNLEYQDFREGGQVAHGRRQVKCEGMQDPMILSGEPTNQKYLVHNRETVEAWLEKTEEIDIDPNTIKPPSAALQEEKSHMMEHHKESGEEESYEGKEYLQGYWTDEKLEANERRKQKAMKKVESFLKLMDEKLEN